MAYCLPSRDVTLMPLSVRSHKSRHTIQIPGAPPFLLQPCLPFLHETNVFYLLHYMHASVLLFDHGDMINSRLFAQIPASAQQYQILGLNLLRLLALNRIAEFHTELELIPLEKHDNIYIKHPIQLEQYIMEGAYGKVFDAAKDLPAPSYAFFMEYLMQTRLK